MNKFGSKEEYKDRGMEVMGVQTKASAFRIGNGGGKKKGSRNMAKE